MDLPVWYPERVDQAPLDLGISAANIPSISVDLERVSFGGLVTSRRSEEGLFIGPAVPWRLVEMDACRVSKTLAALLAQWLER